MPINFFKQPLNHDWTCRKAIIIHQRAIQPIPSSGSSITPKFRAGTNLWALISTCSFKLSSGPINPRQTCWSEPNSGLAPLFSSIVSMIFFWFLFFLQRGGKNAWIFRSIFPAGDQLSRPPSMATRLAQHIAHPLAPDGVWSWQQRETKQEMVVIGANRERKSTLWEGKVDKFVKNWRTEDFFNLRNIKRLTIENLLI